MKLTKTSRSVQDDSFPTFQLFILGLYTLVREVTRANSSTAIIRLSEPIALVSIFPYAWLMVQSFHVGSEDDASFYAGILISAFSFTEAISGMLWGSVSDKIGRKPVMLIGLLGTILSLLMVGFSKSFGLALVGRALGGLLNGNQGVIMTIVGELVKNPAHEPRAYAVMPFVFSIGSVIGPALGGTLANPVKGFPTFFQKGGFFDTFPWALPNLVCAALLLVSVILAYLFLEETHPDLREGSNSQTQHGPTETCPILGTSDVSFDQQVDLRRNSFGTFNEIETTMHDQWRVRQNGSSRTSSVSEKQVDKWFTYRIAMLVTALGIYTCKSDHAVGHFRADNQSIHHF